MVYHRDEAAGRPAECEPGTVVSIYFGECDGLFLVKLADLGLIEPGVLEREVVFSEGSKLDLGRHGLTAILGERVREFTGKIGI